MKKIPTLFVRKFVDGKCVGITDEVTPGLEWVLAGEGVATVKYDGACCAIIGGRLYRRYDAKHGKIPPRNAIPCCNPDPVTGHWPHWKLVEPGNSTDKWFIEAFNNTFLTTIVDNATYEAVGPHFQGNPYNFDEDHLIIHGNVYVDVDRSFEGIREFLRTSKVEGLVFWKDEEPQCKIKRKDFGFAWPMKETKTNEA